MLPRSTIKNVVIMGLALAVLAFAAYRLWLRAEAPGSVRTVKVLSYSAFVSAWGPGPELAALFRAKSGITVEFQDAGDAGLLLQKLELFPSDVVMGFDQLNLHTARATRKWRPLPVDPSLGIRFVGSDQAGSITAGDEFLPFDWGPLAFIYRQGEISPPTSLDDLLDPRFRNAIAIQDPRTSTPGLQLLYWIVDEMGLNEGMEFLERLKPNLHTVAPSWSTAYGVFTKKNASLAFSYVTSPVYHWVEEKEMSYAAAIFPAGHPVQVEFAAVPASCQDCEGGEQFARFLHTPEAQKIIMEKNYMMPVLPSVMKGTVFERLPEVNVRQWEGLTDMLGRRDALLSRWVELGL